MHRHDPFERPAVISLDRLHEAAAAAVDLAAADAQLGLSSLSLDPFGYYQMEP